MGVVTGGGGGGGAAFNGGTITDPLVIDRATGATDLLSVLGHDSGNPVGRAGVTVSRFGQLTLLSETGAGALITVALDDVSSTYNLVEADEAGLTINLSDATFSQFKVSGNSGNVLDCGFNSSSEIIVGFGAGTVGFFGATGAARQTLHSATATPEQIALALEASTLMTGD